MFKKGHNKTKNIKFLLVSMFILCNIFRVLGYTQKRDGVIYILIWTSILDAPFDIIRMGHDAFTNCTFKNCFLTGDYGYLSNEIEFDVIMINAMLLKHGIRLPYNRSQRQKYIMYGVEPAMFHYIPLGFNGYFNLTFTYKLSSDITLPYVLIKDANNTIIGPKTDMSWMKLSDMNEISDNITQKLQNKTIAAAWLVSNCWTPWRGLYVHDLQNELARYGHRLDVYGGCGSPRCSYDQRNKCYPLIESDYYFYLAFENSFGEDYVTEKILHALQHFAVPVVYGGANYSRFMPEGTYLNAGSLEPYKLAKIMNDIIKDKNKYYEFFKWHDHYSYHYTVENKYNESFCNLCAFLNNSRNKTSILEYIADWWNEEQPIWPLSTTISPTDSQPNALEKLVINFLDVLDPSSDD